MYWHGPQRKFTTVKVSTGEKYLLSYNGYRFVYDVNFNDDAEIYFAVEFNGLSSVEIIWFWNHYICQIISYSDIISSNEIKWYNNDFHDKIYGRIIFIRIAQNCHFIQFVRDINLG